jgi:L-asparagine transporter-like permease
MGGEAKLWSVVATEYVAAGLASLRNTTTSLTCTERRGGRNPGGLSIPVISMVMVVVSARATDGCESSVKALPIPRQRIPESTNKQACRVSISLLESFRVLLLYQSSNQISLAGELRRFLDLISISKLLDPIDA